MPFINMTLNDGDSYDPVRTLEFGEDGVVTLRNEFGHWEFSIEQMQGATFTDLEPLQGASCDMENCTKPSITKFDGENLCQHHADMWVCGEGQSLSETIL